MSSAAPIVMPKLGLTMTEGLLASWRVGPGDRVAAGDILFIVETEKIATEIEAQQAGSIGEILIPEGETVPVGAVLATWAGAAPAAGVQKAAAPEMTAAKPAPEPVSVPAPVAGDRVIATPLARRIARRHGLDLALVAGSGPRGRIKQADVQAALAATIAPTEANARPTPAVRATSDRRRPASTMERIVARRLTLSKQTIPHFYVHAEADISRLLDLREELNGSGGQTRLSITHFIMAAVGRALVEMPACNLLWAEDEIIELASPDVGLAVDSERGLLVPVLREAGHLSLDAVADGCGDLVARARSGRLASAELEGGAISVSNVGMFGASHLVPIINPGQSAILGVAAQKPVFRPDANGLPSLRREIGLVLSCDHRVLDGVRAARFLDHIVNTLENPLRLLRQRAAERRPA
ncbi:dihydrolipoamide acetyltransferase family protein [Bosea sp. 2YAB26]|uniref:dihydrolipoamide acetyltransferase family protein n=1 Tax=Bosea sp. 2YAB26 TaxID=3237478 RepID=UPI003F91B1BA